MYHMIVDERRFNSYSYIIFLIFNTMEDNYKQIYDDEDSQDQKSKCRLCAQEEKTKYLIHIFGKEGRKNALDFKIRRCLPIMVQEDDGLPKGVCLTCINKLEVSSELVETVIRAHHAFLSIMVHEPLNTKMERFPESEDEDEDIEPNEQLESAGSTEAEDQNPEKDVEDSPQPEIYDPEDTAMTIKDEPMDMDAYNEIDDEELSRYTDLAPEESENNRIPTETRCSSSSSRTTIRLESATDDVFDSNITSPQAEDSLLLDLMTHPAPLDNQELPLQVDNPDEEPDLIPLESVSSNAAFAQNEKRDLTSSSSYAPYDLSDLMIKEEPLNSPPPQLPSHQDATSAKLNAVGSQQIDNRGTLIDGNSTNPETALFATSAVCSDSTGDEIRDCSVCKLSFPEHEFVHHFAGHFSRKPPLTCEGCSKQFYTEPGFLNHKKKCSKSKSILI